MCSLLFLHSPVEVNGTQAMEFSHNDPLEFSNMSGGVKHIREALLKYEEE